MQNCKLCQEVIAFHEGLKGKRAGLTKILFVAHRPDKRILEPTLPFSEEYEQALFNSQTGKEVSRILEYCGMGWQDIYWTNIFKCVLRGDRNPTPEEYGNCFGVFEQQVKEFKPKKIVALGSTVYGLMFPEQAKEKPSQKMWCQTLQFNGLPVLIFPHPSRIWYKQQKEREQRFYQDVKRFLSS